MAIKIAGTEVINDNRELVLAKLTEINTSIADTAVDIFVYDTRKDSDGGQWRHRCQHTSWYNETLNTATRGSRKEFPAVAVIVAESTQVTIYDGDDPDMPMWMVFNGVGSRGSQTAYYLSSGTLTGLSALNGQISVSHYGTVIINMVADSGIYVGSSADNNRGTFTKPIVERNSVQGYTTPVLTAVHYDHNDVAMTVLPNAPIDAATGLPVPTIAVATDGGVSVIKDDGTVESESDTVAINGLAIVGNKYLQVIRNSNTVPLEVMPLTSVDTVSTRTYRDDGNNSSSYPSLITGLNPSGVISANAIGGSGLVLIDEDYDSVSSDTTNGMVAYQTSTYNTGWMNGDIKLATLSDTDATNVTGSELVTNGTFDSDNSGWTVLGGSPSVSGGQLTTVRSGGSIDWQTQAFATVVGETYIFTYEVVSTINTKDQPYIGTTSGGNQIATIAYSGVGTHFYTFVATTTTTYITLRMGADDTVVWDNISVRLAEEDRSVNGNGLQVFGTVTKSAVATGADLVAYSGFSSSNYLQQPYNSNLDFSGDFSIQTWMYIPSDTTASPYHYGYSLDQDQSILALYVAGAGLRTYTRENGGNWNYTQSSVPLNSWIHLSHQRNGGVVSTFVNGNLTGSYTHTADLTRTGNFMRLGLRTEPGQAAVYWRGSLALFRISATAPSPEQIKKIYEDEKVLFQDNAQATLYGLSDAVTALAYDDSNGILSVGTSAGRSDFQGLRRVNNTTNAVGAAISASNGLIVEE